MYGWEIKLLGWIMLALFVGLTIYFVVKRLNRIPSDDNRGGLKDYTPESVDKKPDGTFQYRDENGKLQEKWMPPEKLKSMLDKGGAKRVYKVLIKGPWDGVKEDFWELSEETLKEFGDEDDAVRVLCVYEKGEPKYNFVAKKMWDRMDEILEIFSNPNLAPEQRAIEVKKLLGE